MLQINNLDLHTDNLMVLNNINLNITPGKVTAILGPNGAGKSSLLKTISQDVTASRGEVHFYHRALKQWPKQELATLLGVLPQESSLHFPFKVFDVVAMGLYPLSLNQKQGQDIIEGYLDNLSIMHLKERPYPSLSGGEKQRVQLARVLTQLSQARKPPLLLLDEPTSALDLAQQHKVLALIQHLVSHRQYSVITVLHDLNLAARYADELIIMKKGQIKKVGSPTHCLTNQTINEIWDYNPQIITVDVDSIPVII
ncbi:heme ABC transporter ATP-binding protein [Shewanella surugensis]|uniref:Heme ABC transporter ATP-binding protein n=1 Tax=Shewanella surugensis TaxID=212020 RepID=A0ABT0LAL4_9GAMM|nr:heme ABC transporter ATP-binding protein [Shewanella surugensis]MCL1124530.1 heme ABC transporter ATP-binding protein [Shewanella surugensis]